MGRRTNPQSNSVDAEASTQSPKRTRSSRGSAVSHTVTPVADPGEPARPAPVEGGRLRTPKRAPQIPDGAVPEMKAKARLKNATEARPEAKVKNTAETRPEARVKVKDVAETRPEAKAKVKNAAETRPEARVKAKDVAEARPEARVKAKDVAEARPEARVKAKDVAEARPEARVRAKNTAEAKPEARVKAKDVAETRAEARVKAKDAAEARVRVKDAAETRVKAQETTEGGFEARSQSAVEAKPEAPTRAPRPVIYPINLDESKIDSDAAKVVTRLVRHGYEGYLVGGCVRDLLVGRSPKDFDVATNARPEDVRRLFRNSRIIGRRFRLVHVLFGGGKVIETATFRRNPSPETEQPDGGLLIRYDNVFGEAHEDAVRRDFTINGLFYDLERGQVLDWVGGMPHIETRTVQTIGDPMVRFLEDPVRILRAIKFAARLDFGIAPDVYDAIVQCRGSLAMAARPRLFEELMRLMRGGAAHRSVWLAWETGVLDVLVPELAAFLSDLDESDGVVWRMLQEVDRRMKVTAAPLDDIVLCAALLLDPMREACSFAVDRVERASEFLEPIVDRLNVPRRIADALRRIVAVMPRLEQGKATKFRKTPLSTLAEEVLDISLAAREARPSVANADHPSAVRPRRQRLRPGATTPTSGA